MNKKIGILASDIELKNSIIEYFSEEVASGKILIEILNSDIIDYQGKLLEEKGSKVIIARDGAITHVEGKVGVPVISLKITGADINRAIIKASKYNKKIVLVIWNRNFFNPDEWGGILKEEIIFEIFSLKEEIKERIEKYKDKKDEYVIVSGGIACGLAKELDMSYVFINAGKESIFETINYAKNLVDDLYKERFNTELFKNILNSIHDAVIAIDENENIIMYNEMAQELLKKDPSGIIYNNIIDVLPELTFLATCLREKVDKNNQIIFLKDIEITANTKLLKFNREIHGALCTFQDITRLQKLEKQIRYKLNKKGLVTKYKFEDIITIDPLMIDTINRAKKIGLTDSTVIIYGESGTGKEMIAQGIHNISKRKTSPFVAINCAAITESLLESELFGYVEGSFTGALKGGKPGLFELAHEGTIFLDEINSLSLNLQSKLLRVIEEKEVMRIGSDYVIPLEIRIIAAANEDLRHKVGDGSFRADLFYRLDTIDVSIPPLRHRKNDILLLFNSFLSEIDPFFSLNLDALMEDRLKSYDWPGNVRELKNITKRYHMFGEIDLGYSINISEQKTLSEENIGSIIDLKQINKYVEDQIISNLLSKGMSKTDISKILGISRTGLWKKMNK